MSGNYIEGDKYSYTSSASVSRKGRSISLSVSMIIFLPLQTGIYRSLLYQIRSNERILTPEKYSPESCIKIIVVRQFGCFKHGAILCGYLLFELLLCHGKRPAFKEMKVLYQDQTSWTRYNKVQKVQTKKVIQ